MDAFLRDSLLAGLTEREICETVVCEMRRRKQYGCIYVINAETKRGTFGSSTPEGLMPDKSAAYQLAIFAQAANTALEEKNRELLPNETEPKGYIN